MKLLRPILSSLAAALLFIALAPSALAAGRSYVDNTTVEQSSTGAIALALAILALFFVLLALIVRLGHTGHLSVHWAVPAAGFASLALLLCVIGVNVGPIYAQPEGDPRQTVTRFFDALITEDYATAYSCLSDYTSLGLEKAPESVNGAKTYAALKASFEYTLSGTPRIDRIYATQGVRFKHLDLDSLQVSVEDAVQRNLEKIVRDSPVEEVYDADKNFLPAVTDKAYSDALSSVLSHASSYYTSSVIDVKLSYESGEWLIITSPELLSALMGGAAY
jgi:hypothetical protein